MKPVSWIAALAIMSAALAATAQPPAPSPLPDTELLVYDRLVGDKREEVEVRTRLVEAAEERYYEIHSHSAEQDVLVKLDPGTLFASYVETTSRGKDATLRRVTAVLESKSSAAPDEFVVSSMESLPYSLRAFPWGAKQKAKLRFLGSGGGAGQGGGDFGFDLSVTGKETIVVGERRVEAWKLQLSLNGFFGAFVGKSYLWYSAEYPHYLVRFEGSSGPGTPKSVLSLRSYSSSASAD